MGTPFHTGERAVQDRANVPSGWRDKAASFIHPEMSDRHRGFFEGIQLIFTALLDHAGRPWATPVEGANLTHEDKASKLKRRPSPGYRNPTITKVTSDEWRSYKELQDSRSRAPHRPAYRCRVPLGWLRDLTPCFSSTAC